MPNEHTIAENLQRLTAAKTAIGNAITAKGGTVAQGDGFEEFAADISNIPYNSDTRNDTVTADTLKSGYTAHNAAGQSITGTLLSQSTTVTAETLGEGVTAYNSAGQLITGTGIIRTDWAGIQTKVRANDMSDIPIGMKYSGFYGRNNTPWDVIDKNIDTPADPNYTNALTLRVHECLPDDLVFDAPEAFYACQSAALSAGNYYYKVGSSYYKFTLTQSVPVGGQLVCTDNATLKSYASGSSTTPIETVSVTSGSSGTNLGTLNDNIRSGNRNTNNRRQYGSNDWRESAIRQWLNSNKPAGQWWTPQNPWDRPPAYAETMNGFMYDLDSDFLAAIGKTQVTTKYFDTSTGDINGTYTTEDYFFLMSQYQVSGISRFSGEGTKYAPYSSANETRIMLKNGSETNYWLRSPITYSQFAAVVESYGGVGAAYAAYKSAGIVPVCNII